ncbi:MAG: hypothetical protein ACREMK_02105 [Gemmatimonadota bacterium]
MRRIGAGWVSKTALLAVLGCGSGTEAPVSLDTSDRDLRIAVASGDHQRGPVGTSLSDLLVAQVTDEAVLPVEDVRVRWEVVEGGGALSLKRIRTDPQGLSAAVYFLGDEVGEHVVRALLENGEEARFTVLATELGGAATPASAAAGGR